MYLKKMRLYICAIARMLTCMLCKSELVSIYARVSVYFNSGNSVQNPLTPSSEMPFIMQWSNSRYLLLTYSSAQYSSNRVFFLTFSFFLLFSSYTHTLSLSFSFSCSLSLFRVKLFYKLFNFPLLALIHSLFRRHFLLSSIWMLFSSLSLSFYLTLSLSISLSLSLFLFLFLSSRSVSTHHLFPSCGAKQRDLIIAYFGQRKS